jgi:hypothetical protein
LHNEFVVLLTNPLVLGFRPINIFSVKFMIEIDGFMLELGFNSTVDRVEIDFECAVTTVHAKLLAGDSRHLIVAKIVVLVEVSFRCSLVTRF